MRAGYGLRGHAIWWLLASVTVVYAVIQLVVVTPHMGLGWDEAVYASQLARGVPATSFTAPRARGVTLLVGPLVGVTTSLTALRVYLSVVSALGLFGVFAIWLRVRSSPSVPLAAGLFATCWTVIFYGNEAMPNLYVAYGGLAAVGLLVLYLRRPSWKPAAGLAAALAWTALVRPSDSLWIALPMLVATVAVHRRRATRAVAVIVGGLAAGWAEWIIEAQIRFGGTAKRLAAASAENETGLHASIVDHLRALDGPLLCRGTTNCGPVLPTSTAWVAGLLVMVVIGLVSVRRTTAFRPLVLAAACGASIGLSYVFLVGYAAPRFLIPMFALLSLPAGEGLWALGRGTVRAGSTRWLRVAAAALAVLLVTVHLGVQGLDLHRQVAANLSSRGDQVRVAAALERMDIDAPCDILGDDAVAIAYTAHCRSVGVPSSFWSTDALPTIDRALAERIPLWIVRHDATAPAALGRHWRRLLLLAEAGQRPWYLYLAPSPAHGHPTG